MKAKYIILVICIVLLLGIYINYFSPVHAADAADLETTTSGVTQTTKTYSEPTTKSAEVDDIPDTTEIASLETTELFDNKPLTPDGSGTVMDDVFENDGKEIFSITTEDGNVFYLIIDRQRESDNVYFLNTVTEEDLLALAQKKGIEIPTEISIIPTIEPVPATENIAATSVPEPENKGDTGGFDIKIIIIIIAVIGVIGAGYYFKIYKNKKKPPESEDDDIDDYADETDDSDDGDDYADSDDGE